eukprot:scaffold59842_cov64-Phaeocystis_antarctica.AAC.6
MNTEPPTISERSREKSNDSPRCVATAIPVNTSGAPLPRASRVTPATSGESLRRVDRYASCGIRKTSAVVPSA